MAIVAKIIEGTAMMLLKTGTLFLVLSSAGAASAKGSVRSSSGTQIRSFQPAGYEFPSGYYKRTQFHFMPAGYEFKAGYYRREPELMNVKTPYDEETQPDRSKRALEPTKRFISGYDGMKAGYYKRIVDPAQTSDVKVLSMHRSKRAIPGYDFKAGYYKRASKEGQGTQYLIEGVPFYKRGIPGYDFKAGYY